jgi:hypothetical protein
MLHTHTSHLTQQVASGDFAASTLESARYLSLPPSLPPSPSASFLSLALSLSPSPLPPSPSPLPLLSLPDGGSGCSVYLKCLCAPSRDRQLRAAKGRVRTAGCAITRRHDGAPTFAPLFQLPPPLEKAEGEGGGTEILKGFVQGTLELKTT